VWGISLRFCAMTSQTKKRKVDDTAVLLEEGARSANGNVNPLRILLRDEFDAIAKSAVLDDANTRRLQTFLDKLKSLLVNASPATVSDSRNDSFDMAC
jgi:hypothetical protein